MFYIEFYNEQVNNNSGSNKINNNNNNNNNSNIETMRLDSKASYLQLIVSML